MITMSKKEEKKTVICCVLNCQKEMPIENAIKMGDKFYCGICGSAQIRSALNI